MGRSLVAVALMCLVSAFWLPWWVVRYADASGAVYETIAPRLFASAPPYSTTVAPNVTGVLVAVVAIALFVRLAGRSWYHEPAAWLRTLIGGAVALLLCLIGSVFWPAEVPTFWGKHTYELTESGDVFTETALPGLAWWLVLVAIAALAGAWWVSRAQLAVDASDK